MQALALVLLAVVLSCGAVSAAALTGTMRTPYFTVRFAPADRDLARTTATTAQAELERISSSLGYKLEPNKPLPLLVYGSHLAFINAGKIKDRMTVGTARTGDEAISVDASGRLISTRQVIAHEVAHAVTFRILGANSYALPLWANEGIAKYYSQGFAGDDEAIVGEAVANGTLIPLANLTVAFPSDRSELAYAESWSAIRYLVKERGRSAPGRLLAETARTSSFDSAISSVTNQTSSEFIGAWNDSLKGRFSAMRALKIASAFLWPMMAVLAIIAFIVRRRKMREAARQWEWEEFEESMERQLREWPHR